MIDKRRQAGDGRERPAKGRRAARLKRGDPVEVELTVSFKFGDEPGDTLTPIRDRRVPMVGSVFASRDRILRAFVRLMYKTGMSSPKVASQLLPVARLLRRRPQ